jgi:hypothetical protein
MRTKTMRTTRTTKMMRMRRRNVGKPLVLRLLSLMQMRKRWRC